eukprot:280119-Rhodomonas_salina.1
MEMLIVKSSSSRCCSSNTPVRSSSQAGGSITGKMSHSQGSKAMASVSVRGTIVGSRPGTR